MKVAAVGGFIWFAWTLGPWWPFLAKPKVLQENGPQIWTRGKRLIKGRYLNDDATL